MKNKSLVSSFAHAFEGLSHMLWTQRHVRYQLTILMVVLLLSYWMKLNTFQVLFLLSAAAAVLIAELFNTAIEVVVNMITEHYHPLAKIAKDVAAGGVLIASIYAVIVAVAVFLNPETVQNFLHNAENYHGIESRQLVVTLLVGIATLFIIVPLAKIRIGKGSIIRGGAVSGHSAVAFLLFSAIAVATKFNPVTSLLALVLAVLVAQSRVEGKIHTLAEVLWGATVALGLMALLILLSK